MSYPESGIDPLEKCKSCGHSEWMHRLDERGNEVIRHKPGKCGKRTEDVPCDCQKFVGKREMKHG